MYDGQDIENRCAEILMNISDRNSRVKQYK